MLLSKGIDLSKQIGEDVVTSSKLLQNGIAVRAGRPGALKPSHRCTSAHAMIIHRRYAAKAQSASGVFDVAVCRLVGYA
jgi:hypothetical protein